MGEPTGSTKSEKDGSLALHPNGSSVRHPNCSKQGHTGATEEGCSKESQNASDHKEIKDEVQQTPEHERERKEAAEEDGNTPGLPRFLSHLVKVGEYMPVATTQSGEILMEEEHFMVEAPSLVTPLLVKKPDQFLTENGESSIQKVEEKGVPLVGKGSSSPADYFASTAGQFLIGLGLSQALQLVNRDLMRSKERELKKAVSRTRDTAEEHRKLTEAYQQAKTANAPFTFKLKHCRVCDFKTESDLVLNGHLLTPHLTARRELQCSFCSFSTRDARAIVFHMKALHNRLPTMEPAPHFYECPFCPFETNLKSKSNVHINRCQKHFISSLNQTPHERFEPPGVTLKPFTVKDIAAYRKARMEFVSNAIVSGKGIQNRPFSVLNQNGAHLLAGSRGPSYQQLSSVASSNQNQERGRSKLTYIQPTPASNRTYQVVAGNSPLLPLLNASPQLSVTRAPVPSSSGNVRSATLHGTAPLLAQLQAPSGQRPRTPAESSGTTASFVICEICDGYIKDLEQLRTHMQWIHKVKIHPKMLATRPPLNCQKCQWRFFTDQGLERHLLGAHGLVTSNMQDQANSGQDSGRCTVCGRIYASKLVAHMSQVHRVVLKPAHLSYKCTVCTETFGLYRLFEAHVYTMHSGPTKRTSSAAASDDRPAKRPALFPRSTPSGRGNAEVIPAKANKTVAGLKEISITPVVPVPTMSVSRTKVKEDPVSVDVAPAAPTKPADPLLGTLCMTCEANVEDLPEHLKENHLRSCHVRVCHIEKCDQCLGSFNGMIVVRTSDVGEDDSSEDEAEEDETENCEGNEGAVQEEPRNNLESHSRTKDITGLGSKKEDGDGQSGKGECKEGVSQQEHVDLGEPHGGKDIASLESKKEGMDGQCEKRECENSLLPRSMNLNGPHSANDIAGQDSEKEDVGSQGENGEDKEDATQPEPVDLDGTHSLRDIAGLNSKRECIGGQCENGKNEKDATHPEPMDLDGPHSISDIAGLNSKRKDMGGKCEDEEDVTHPEPMELVEPHDANGIVGLNSK